MSKEKIFNIEIPKARIPSGNIIDKYIKFKKYQL